MLAKLRLYGRHEIGKVKTVGINLVNHDHARQAACSGSVHHAGGRQFDTGLCIDDDQRSIHTGQRCHRLSGKIRITWRID